MASFAAEERRILFSETDMAGWVHNSHFMRFVENAEHEFFLSCGYSPITKEGGWPRVNFTIDFRKPLVFNDPYQVTLKIGRLGTTSITWNFEILSLDHLIAEGKMTSTYVNNQGKPTPYPDDLKEQVKKTFHI